LGIFSLYPTYAIAKFGYFLLAYTNLAMANFV
jgi:hypothetical protein